MAHVIGQPHSVFPFFVIPFPAVLSVLLVIQLSEFFIWFEVEVGKF